MLAVLLIGDRRIPRSGDSPDREPSKHACGKDRRGNRKPPWRSRTTILPIDEKTVADPRAGVAGCGDRSDRSAGRGSRSAPITIWQSRFYESTDDAYVEGHPVFLSARVSGNIAQVHVRENERVEEGEPVVEVDPCDYQIRRAKAQAAARVGAGR